MLYSTMRRTQLYLDEGQYRWLRQRSGRGGSIAAVVRELIDAARAAEAGAGEDDPLVAYLLSEPADGHAASSVTQLDEDLYGG